MAMTLPDVNEVLLPSAGAAGPISAGRLWWKAKRRRWRACRVFVLGVWMLPGSCSVYRWTMSMVGCSRIGCPLSA
jgi:hypothetical protein